MENNFQYPNYNHGNEGFAIASLIIGIISFLFSCCFFYLSIIIAPIGLALGVVTLLKHYSGKGMAIAGATLSGISLAICLIWILCMGFQFLSKISN